MNATLDDYRWLISDAAQPWLTMAELAASATLVQLTQTLRRSLSLEQTHLILEQVELRRRAVTKFADAKSLFFTRKSLEQATDDSIARYKASRFLPGKRVVDLCCGIGGDLLALASHGEATGVDRDEVIALLAQANVSRRSLTANVQATDVGNVNLHEFAAWHVDPDRREDGKRRTELTLLAPGPDLLNGWRAENPNGSVKLAPATIVPESWAEAAELEWIGSRGECRQQVVWFGDLVRHCGRRTATIVGVEQSPIRTIVGEPDVSIEVATEVARFIMEPHAAVLAARLAGELAAEHQLRSLGPGGGYLTGDIPTIDAALALFEVDEVLPLDIRRLRSLLEARHIGRLEIKSRVRDLTPESLRPKLKLRGSAEATLILSPTHNGRIAILAKRVERLTP